MTNNIDITAHSYKIPKYAGVAELAYARGLGPRSSECGFDSHRLHKFNS